MELLKQKVKELIVNQDHILKAVKYLHETIENISENRNSDKGNVEDMLENDTTLKMLNTRIDILNSEVETLKSTIKDKPIIKDEPAVKDKPVDKGKIVVKDKVQAAENTERIIQYNSYGKTFGRFSDLESRVKTFHENHPEFKCEVCEKTFVLKWRLRKHMKIHNGHVQPCHYYNNNKTCPFEELGCKFNHINSENCVLLNHVKTESAPSNII